MLKRTIKKRPTDINLLAASIVKATTTEELPESTKKEKNPAAVALGRLGGLRAEKHVLRNDRRRDVKP